MAQVTVTNDPTVESNQVKEGTAYGIKVAVPSGCRSAHYADVSMLVGGQLRLLPAFHAISLNPWVLGVIFKGYYYEFTTHPCNLVSSWRPLIQEEPAKKVTLEKNWKTFWPREQSQRVFVLNDLPFHSTFFLMPKRMAHGCPF